jgi:hypothetical protein
MSLIKKILEIKTIETEFLSNFFNLLDSKDLEYPYFLKKDNVKNNCVYMKEMINGEKLIEIKDTAIGYLIKNNELYENISKVIEQIKNIFSPTIIWLMCYPPKSSIAFHEDKNKNRHILTLNNDERFFSYECDFSVLIEKINNNLIDLNNNIDEFNNFFKNYDKSCHILNLDSCSVYAFQNSIHSFVNDSNKIRINLVFEI